MKVYIVLSYFIHEDPEIEKVFADQQTANNWAAEQERKCFRQYKTSTTKYYIVKEFEVSK